MSTSPNFGLTMQLVNELRRLGATRIKIGDTEVVFDGPPIQVQPPEQPADEAALKRMHEQLMYGSSD